MWVGTSLETDGCCTNGAAKAISWQRAGQRSASHPCFILRTSLGWLYAFTTLTSVPQRKMNILDRNGRLCDEVHFPPSEIPTGDARAPAAAHLEVFLCSSMDTDSKLLSMTFCQFMLAWCLTKACIHVVPDEPRQQVLPTSLGSNVLTRRCDVLGCLRSGIHQGSSWP